ncbi:hypothetical protein R3P38DRAFT_3445906 [Favolaschia claudopus]|uniref:Uncharacterized protein n=1 Tax=Favolaschia claudopus TaxID=2862362 RepID=A0AAV9ZMR4_9AGAR
MESENSSLKENNEALVSRADELARRLHNKSRQANRARLSADGLRAELNRSKHARAVQAVRLGRRKTDGIGKAMKLARVSDTKRWMKGKGGIFVEKSREMVRELVALKVTPENVDPVIHTVGTGLGLQVQDHISARQVGRVMEEGGIASDVQVAMEINASKAATASATDHTSESQMEGWRTVLVEGLVGTYNASPLGRANPIDVDEFITFIKALGTDHANDQKKLARLITEWVRNSRTVMLGKRWLSSASMQQYMPTILQFSNDKIANAGGLDAWNALSEEEKAIRDIEVCRALYCHFGEQEWKNLSAEERFEAESLVWCGCCMHKEMNSVKGGVEGMKLFWESIGGPAPVKLMNKANASAVKNSNSGSAASEKALDASEGGAVKLTSLPGALFNHKDDKRGQQDTFKLYFEDVLGFKVSCPDTSNTRFQSHCDCAIFIILYLPQILQFMSHIMYNKGKTALNHLEANVLKGLQDIPTLTELVVLALYANAVSYAYMRVVRATGNRKMNALDLAEFHKKVISFCEKIAENPDLLLAPDASYETGTLHGQVWEHPEVFYAIQQLKSKLPNLSGCLKSFFVGTFRLSAAARALIYANPTNYRNEGALGVLRRAVREAARLSLSVHNAKSKYTVNDTRQFLQSPAVTDAFRAWLRAEARRRIDSGRDRKCRMKIVAHEKVVAAEKEAAEVKRKAGGRAHKSITTTELIKNINWHRQFVEVGVIPAKTLISKMPKESKVRQLIAAVERYNKQILPRLQMLALAAMTAGVSDKDGVDGIPIVDSWDAEDEGLEEDMLDDYD